MNDCEHLPPPCPACGVEPHTLAARFQQQVQTAEERVGATIVAHVIDLLEDSDIETPDENYWTPEELKDPEVWVNHHVEKVVQQLREMTATDEFIVMPRTVLKVMTQGDEEAVAAIDDLRRYLFKTQTLDEQRAEMEAARVRHKH